MPDRVEAPRRPRFDADHMSQGDGELRDKKTLTRSLHAQPLILRGDAFSEHPSPLTPSAPRGCHRDDACDRMSARDIARLRRIMGKQWECDSVETRVGSGAWQEVGRWPHTGRGNDAHSSGCARQYSPTKVPVRCQGIAPTSEDTSTGHLMVPSGRESSRTVSIASGIPRSGGRLPSSTCPAA